MKRAKRKHEAKENAEPVKKPRTHNLVHPDFANRKVVLQNMTTHTKSYETIISGMKTTLHTQKTLQESLVQDREKLEEIKSQIQTLCQSGETKSKTPQPPVPQRLTTSASSSQLEYSDVLSLGPQEWTRQAKMYLYDLATTSQTPSETVWDNRVSFLHQNAKWLAMDTLFSESIYKNISPLLKSRLLNNTWIVMYSKRDLLSNSRRLNRKGISYVITQRNQTVGVRFCFDVHVEGGRFKMKSHVLTFDHTNSLDIQMAKCGVVEGTKNVYNSDVGARWKQQAQPFLRWVDCFKTITDPKLENKPKCRVSMEGCKLVYRLLKIPTNGSILPQDLFFGFGTPSSFLAIKRGIGEFLASQTSHDTSSPIVELSKVSNVESVVSPGFYATIKPKTDTQQDFTGAQQQTGVANTNGVTKATQQQPFEPTASRKPRPGTFTLITAGDRFYAYRRWSKSHGGIAALPIPQLHRIVETYIGELVL